MFPSKPEPPALTARRPGLHGHRTAITILSLFLLLTVAQTGCASVLGPDIAPIGQRKPPEPKTRRIRSTCPQLNDVFESGGAFFKITRPSNLPAEKGRAAYYGRKFHGRRTASGERFDMHKLTAAHRRLPFQTWVRITNLDNNRSVCVRINDRGPANKRLLLDMSRAAAAKLGLLQAGKANVRIDILGNAKPIPPPQSLPSLAAPATAVIQASP